MRNSNEHPKEGFVIATAGQSSVSLNRRDSAHIRLCVMQLDLLSFVSATAAAI